MEKLKMQELIRKKSRGEPLSAEDIRCFINVVSKVNADVDVYCQVGAMLMAIFSNGLNWQETEQLVQEMKMSGTVFSWPEKWKHLVVDKHSTGGVGDKISLMLAPLLAALGLKVPMISGRSLAHTGGTLDKLESIPGYKVLLSREEMENIVESVGCCIVGQTDDVVPADKVLYHCREITSTVESKPLIVGSIVSKKLSVNPRALVFDVKFGKGSHFSSVDEAIDMGKKLVEVSKSVKSCALVTSMENPLGKKIGNSLEVIEAVECLKGVWSPDLFELTTTLAKEILRLVYNKSYKESEGLIDTALNTGKALQKFHDMIIQQGVSSNVARELCYGDTESVLSKADSATLINYIGNGGYVVEIDSRVLGTTWKELAMESDNPGIGYKILNGAGDKIENGDAWLEVHHMKPLTNALTSKLQNALLVKPTAEKKPFIVKRIYYDNDFNLVIEAPE